MQNIQQVLLAAHSLQFVWREPRGRMSLDFETVRWRVTALVQPLVLATSLISDDQVRNLELLSNARTGDAKGSLFGVMNHTRTSVGTRLLRSNILSPCNDLPTLHARLDAVDALLGSEAVYSGLGALLPKLADLDALLSFFVATPK